MAAVNEAYEVLSNPGTPFFVFSQHSSGTDSTSLHTQNCANDSTTATIRTTRWRARAAGTRSQAVSRVAVVVIRSRSSSSRAELGAGSSSISVDGISGSCGLVGIEKAASQRKRRRRRRTGEKGGRRVLLAEEDAEDQTSMLCNMLYYITHVIMSLNDDEWTFDSIGCIRRALSSCTYRCGDDLCARPLSIVQNRNQWPHKNTLSLRADTITSNINNHEHQLQLWVRVLEVNKVAALDSLDDL